MSDDPCQISLQPFAKAKDCFEALLVGSFRMDVMLRSGLVLGCVFASRRSARRSCAYGREIRASYCVFGYWVGMCAS
jgi:hypothetical protein